MLGKSLCDKGLLFGIDVLFSIFHAVIKPFSKVGNQILLNG
ncbi:hypothetical protein EVA_09704 [gut metagenome]|uniref:Uncharacterized protein n=1 Tax=gut metagenome TaxID=749906 RepID=J9GQ91_9ZZZZ